MTEKNQFHRQLGDRHVRRGAARTANVSGFARPVRHGFAYCGPRHRVPLLPVSKIESTRSLLPDIASPEIAARGEDDVPVARCRFKVPSGFIATRVIVVPM